MAEPTSAATLCRRMEKLTSETGREERTSFSCVEIYDFEGEMELPLPVMDLPLPVMAATRITPTLYLPSFSTLCFSIRGIPISYGKCNPGELRQNNQMIRG